jgi:hypothetical protein
VLNFPNLAEIGHCGQSGLNLGQIGKIQHLTRFETRLNHRSKRPDANAFRLMGRGHFG